MRTSMASCPPPGNVAAGAAIRCEGDRAGLGAQPGIDEGDIGQAVVGHIFLQNAKDDRVRFKADDPGLGVDAFEVEDGHAHVAAAVNDQRGGPLRLEMVDAPDELVLVLHVEVGAVGDADSIAHATLAAGCSRRDSEHAPAETLQPPVCCAAIKRLCPSPDAAAHGMGQHASGGAT